MNEEMLEALMILIESRIDEMIGAANGTDSSCELARFYELRVDFINDFIFKDGPTAAIAGSAAIGLRQGDKPK